MLNRRQRHRVILNENGSFDGMSSTRTPSRSATMLSGRRFNKVPARLRPPSGVLNPTPHIDATQQHHAPPKNHRRRHHHNSNQHQNQNQNQSQNHKKAHNKPSNTPVGQLQQHKQQHKQQHAHKRGNKVESPKPVQSRRPFMAECDESATAENYHDSSSKDRIGCNEPLSDVSISYWTRLPHIGGVLI